MVSATDQRREPFDNEMVMPTWLVWLQLGLSTTLAVLFVVMLVKTRQQSVNIRQLQDRVAGIENSRALDRTTAICLLYTSPSPRDLSTSRMPSSA